MIKGSIVALVTPFNDDLSVNYTALKALIEFHIAHETDGLLVLGTTGEAPTIDFEDQLQIVDFTVKQAAGRIHVMAGACSNDTAKSLKAAQAFEALGADSLLAIAPYYNKTNEAGMIAHFSAIADGVSIPVILYNVPGRTGCAISENVLRVLAAHPRIAGVKEASGDLAYMVSISRLLNDEFLLFTGNDDAIYAATALGGSGVISVWANIMPRETRDVYWLYANGRQQESLSLQQRCLDLVHMLFCETNPIPIKYAMDCLGFETGPLKLPLAPLSLQYRPRLETLLAEAGLKSPNSNKDFHDLL